MSLFLVSQECKGLANSLLAPIAAARCCASGVNVLVVTAAITVVKRAFLADRTHERVGHVLSLSGLADMRDDSRACYRNLLQHLGNGLFNLPVILRCLFVGVTAQAIARIMLFRRSKTR